MALNLVGDRFADAALYLVEFEIYGNGRFIYELCWQRGHAPDETVPVQNWRLWRERLARLDDGPLYIDSNKPDIMLTSILHGSKGILRSIDGGKTWMDFIVTRPATPRAALPAAAVPAKSFITCYGADRKTL